MNFFKELEQRIGVGARYVGNLRDSPIIRKKCDVDGKRFS